MFPIFAKLGGQEAALDLIEKATGRRPTRFSLKKWRAARRIPGHKMAILMEEAEKRGLPFSGADFERPEPAPEQTGAAA